MTALVLKAYALRSVGRFADAEAVTKRALKIDPECSDLHQESGFIAMRFEPALAEEHFREALRKDPNDKVSQKALKEARAQNTWYYRIIRRVFKVDILLPYYVVFFIAHFSFVDKHPFMPDKSYHIMMGLLLYAPVLLALATLFIAWLCKIVMPVFGVKVDNVGGAQRVSGKSSEPDDFAHSAKTETYYAEEKSPSKVRNAPRIVQFLKMNTQPYVWLILVFVFLRFIAALVQGIN